MHLRSLSAPVLRCHLERLSGRGQVALLVAAAMLFQLMLASAHASRRIVEVASGDTLAISSLCSSWGQQPDSNWAHHRPSLPPPDPEKCPLCQHQLHVTGLPISGPALPRQHFFTVAAVAVTVTPPAALSARLARPEPRAPPQLG